MVGVRGGGALGVVGSRTRVKGGGGLGVVGDGGGIGVVGV